MGDIESENHEGRLPSGSTDSTHKQERRTRAAPGPARRSPEPARVAHRAHALRIPYRIASRCSSQRRGAPSKLVNGKVTMPGGNSATPTPQLAWTRQASKPGKPDHRHQKPARPEADLARSLSLVARRLERFPLQITRIRRSGGPLQNLRSVRAAGAGRRRASPSIRDPPIACTLGRDESEDRRHDEVDRLHTRSRT